MWSVTKSHWDKSDLPVYEEKESLVPEEMMRTLYTTSEKEQRTKVMV